MKILIACEESQTVCLAFREKGHEAYSCDIQECSGGHPEWHIQGDVLPYIDGYCEFTTMDGIKHAIDGKWDLLIAHPPCQYLTNSGNPYLNVEKYGQKAIERKQKQLEAFEFFMAFANANCDKICIENPIGYVNSHYRKPNQIIHPWMFGHPFTKGTCFWLKGLETLKPTVDKKPEDCKSFAILTNIDENGKTISWNSEKNRRLRSKTFEGVAQAMADQWG